MDGRMEHKRSRRVARRRAVDACAAVMLAGVMGAALGPVAARADDTVIGVGRVDGQHQYILDYAKQPGVEMSTNGVAYRYLRKGPPVGAQPTVDGRVRVHYEGRLTTGQVFDSSYERDETAVMSLPKVIPAWQEVIPRMHVGDKIEMAVPAEMGYGQRGGADGVIPPGATLIFKVELFEVLPKEVGPKQH